MHSACWVESGHCECEPILGLVPVTQFEYRSLKCSRDIFSIRIRFPKQDEDDPLQSLNSLLKLLWPDPQNPYIS